MMYDCVLTVWIDHLNSYYRKTCKFPMVPKSDDRLRCDGNIKLIVQVTRYVENSRKIYLFVKTTHMIHRNTLEENGWEKLQ